VQQERDRLYQENKKLKEELDRIKEGPLKPTKIINVFDFCDY
jgi:cell shape-determining protein MreC